MNQNLVAQLAACTTVFPLRCELRSDLQERPPDFGPIAPPSEAKWASLSNAPRNHEVRTAFPATFKMPATPDGSYRTKVSATPSSRGCYRAKKKAARASKLIASMLEPQLGGWVLTARLLPGQRRGEARFIDQAARRDTRGAFRHRPAYGSRVPSAT